MQRPQRGAVPPSLFMNHKTGISPGFASALLAPSFQRYASRRAYGVAVRSWHQAGIFPSAWIVDLRAWRAVPGPWGLQRRRCNANSGGERDIGAEADEGPDTGCGAASKAAE